MMGHGVLFDDGEFGLTCDAANLGKTWGRGRCTVTEESVRPAAEASADQEVRTDG